MASQANGSGLQELPFPATINTCELLVVGEPTAEAGHRKGEAVKQFCVLNQWRKGRWVSYESSIPLFGEEAVQTVAVAFSVGCYSVNTRFHVSVSRIKGFAVQVFCSPSIAFRHRRSGRHVRVPSIPYSSSHHLYPSSFQHWHSNPYTTNIAFDMHVSVNCTFFMSLSLLPLVTFSKPVSADLHVPYS